MCALLCFFVGLAHLTDQLSLSNISTDPPDINLGTGGPPRLRTFVGDASVFNINSVVSEPFAKTDNF